MRTLILVLLLLPASAWADTSNTFYSSIGGDLSQGEARELFSPPCELARARRPLLLAEFREHRLGVVLCERIEARAPRRRVREAPAVADRSLDRLRPLLRLFAVRKRFGLCRAPFYSHLRAVGTPRWSAD